MIRSVKIRQLYIESEKRVLLLDGAMGTMLQDLRLPAGAFTLKSAEAHIHAPGCSDLLSLNMPGKVMDIHLSYLRAGADIIETNTFGANRISLASYGLQGALRSINRSAVHAAMSAVQIYQREQPGRTVWIAGVLGSSGAVASFSLSVNDPARREHLFKDFSEMYREQAEILLDEGVDLLLFETAFDTLALKAGLYSVFALLEERNSDVPVMVSATFSDKSRRMLAGQTMEAFVHSLSSYPLFSLGVNCSTGAEEMLPLIRDLSRFSPFRSSAHPNAGFPDRDGRYTQTAEAFAGMIKTSLKAGQLNIVGGCCGTRPEHIAALAKLIPGAGVRVLPAMQSSLRLSGLDALNVQRGSELLIIGERANVAGSRKFARLIREARYDEALALTREQIELGAQVLDICMDDPLIDAPAVMRHFLRLAAADPAIARVPLMIDSSDWPVIEAALPEIQGRCIVNSISLKDGEAAFIEKARYINKMGAVAMVMLFDERGPAANFERKCTVAERTYRLLTEQAGLDPASLVFDPGILAIATGMEEDYYHASDFIRVTAWIRNYFPAARISGGLSNLSFAFRGNDIFREAIHAVFLELAIQAGLDMAIMNPATALAAADIPENDAAIIRNALIPEAGQEAKAVDALIALAEGYGKKHEKVKISDKDLNAGRQKKDVHERLRETLIHGDDSRLERDLHAAQDTEAVALIEGPLMDGMTQVGMLFGEGKMFLPQVVRSARIMKKAVDILRPRLNEAGTAVKKKKGRVLLATVKGDVHDIGKNIVSLVLACNNFEIIDLGVMVDPEIILRKTLEEKPDIVGLSGLITPSLSEMAEVCRLFEAHHLDVPLMIGGATTSELHSALKLAPLYPGRLLYVPDASQAAQCALKLVSGDSRTYLEENTDRYRKLAEKMSRKSGRLLSLEAARKLCFVKEKPAPAPLQYGVFEIRDIRLDDLIPFISWSMMAQSWQMPPDSPEAVRLKTESLELLSEHSVKSLFNGAIRAVIGLFPAASQDEDVYVFDRESQKRIATLHFLRRQHIAKGRPALCLADYICRDSKPVDTIGLFAATAGLGVDKAVSQYRETGDEHRALMIGILANCLAEALSEYLQERLKKEWWGLGDTPLIRPAAGYPVAPDHSEKITIFHLLQAEKRSGIKLTDNYAMQPAASVCAYYFAGEGLRYFNPGPIGRDQLRAYADKKGIPLPALYRTGIITEENEAEESSG